MTAPPFRIDTIWAYLAWEPDADGRDAEGIAAYLGTDGMWLPMIGADEERVKSLREMAETISFTTGKALRLVRFDRVEVVEEISPSGPRPPA